MVGPCVIECEAGVFGTSSVGIAGGTSLVLPRGGRNGDAAWRLVEYLSRPEVQRRFHALSGNLPPRRSTWAHPELAEDPLAAAFRDQLERVRPAPRVLEWERIAQEIRLVTERVVRGGLALFNEARV